MSLTLICLACSMRPRFGPWRQEHKGPAVGASKPVQHVGKFIMLTEELMRAFGGAVSVLSGCHGHAGGHEGHDEEAHWPRDQHHLCSGPFRQRRAGVQQHYSDIPHFGRVESPALIVTPWADVTMKNQLIHTSLQQGQVCSARRQITQLLRRASLA